ncbi:MAG: TolC family protein [Nitrospirae bacterium]|nr:MAG: TolC family protein [Nitrospirota bacterium]
MSVVNSARIICVGFSVLFLSLFNSHAYSALNEIEGKTLTLDECIDIGLQTNPSAEISLQNLKGHQERVGEAKGGYYPSFKLSSSYAYTTPLDSRAATSPDLYDTRFYVKQTLYDAGATSNLVEGARQNIRVQEYDVRKIKLDIVLNIKGAFYEALKRRDLLGAAKNSLDSAEKHLEQAKALYGEGLSPRSDVIKTEVQVSNARLDLIKAENALLFAKANLAAAMGLSAAMTFEIKAEAPDPQTPLLPTLTATMAHAYDRRPEVRGVKAKIESAHTSIKQIESGLYPNLSIDASYGWQETNFIPQDRKWSVGLTVSIPVFERLTTQSKINQAKANLNGTKAVELQTLRNVELEVRQAWLSLKEALERAGVTKKTLEQAGEDMRVSEGRYKEGLGNVLELIDAQTALTQAKTNDIVSIYDIANAKAKLDRATGEDMRKETK